MALYETSLFLKCCYDILFVFVPTTISGLILSSDSETDCNSPNEKPITSTLADEINLVDVCSNRKVFEVFSKEWSEQKSFAIGILQILEYKVKLDVMFFITSYRMLKV